MAAVSSSGSPPSYNSPGVPPPAYKDIGTQSIEVCKPTDAEINARILCAITTTVSSLVILVFSTLTMTGVVTPLVGGSVILGVAALSGVLEAVQLAKGLGKHSVVPIILKIATTSIYVVISSLAIANILTGYTLGVAILPTLLVGGLAIGGAATLNSVGNRDNYSKGQPSSSNREQNPSTPTRQDAPLTTPPTPSSAPAKPTTQPPTQPYYLNPRFRSGLSQQAEDELTRLIQEEFKDHPTMKPNDCPMYRTAIINGHIKSEARKELFIRDRARKYNDDYKAAKRSYAAEVASFNQAEQARYPTSDPLCEKAYIDATLSGLGYKNEILRHMDAILDSK